MERERAIQFLQGGKSRVALYGKRKRNKSALMLVKLEATNNRFLTIPWQDRPGPRHARPFLVSVAVSGILEGRARPHI